jgi:hypothetical protein
MMDVHKLNVNRVFCETALLTVLMSCIWDQMNRVLDPISNRDGGRNMLKMCYSCSQSQLIFSALISEVIGCGYVTSKVRDHIW